MDPSAMEAAMKSSGIDAELRKLKDRGNRRWYVNSQGQTFAVIEGPVEFRMGSPPTEPERLSYEILHRRIDPPAVRHRYPGGDGRAVPGVCEREPGGRSCQE